MSFEKINRLTGWLLFAFTTSLYILTLEPTASFWDSGEFIATSYKLEIPHPPGAPLFLLIGRMFSFLSFGNPEWVAFSVNSLSAVASGLTVMSLYWTIVMLAEKLVRKDNSSKALLILSGVTGSLAYAFSDSFWFSATETEVYALSTFLTSLVFWCILKWEKLDDPSDQNRWLILIAYLMGLSVGIHLLNLLTIPVIALVYYYKKNQKPTRWGLVATLMISCLTLVGILYGLITFANLAKYFELVFVNSFGLPFGTGAVFFGILVLSGWVFCVRKTQLKRRVNWNTALLAVGFIFIGYSSYSVILIRANQSPPINQNDPNNILGLIYYLNMDQYPKRPLLYGRNFDAQLVDQKQGKTVYEQGEEKYLVKDHIIQNIYEDEKQTLFPRMYSTFDDSHPGAYRSAVGLRNGESPTFADNMKFMIGHQIGHMYLRYFLWNFAGREGSFQNASWLTPVNYFDVLPEALQNDRARNNYFMLPLLLGIIGLIWLYQKDKKLFFTLGTLFVMTGLAIVVYVNAPPIEPRERDYVYVGSYYVFAIWIGMSIIGLFHFVQKRLRTKGALIPVGAIGLLAVGLMLAQNFDDHNRSNRYYSIDQAKNMLAECEPNAILFTGGDNDTYPLWYAQEVEGFRTDVRVVVLSYANADWYINQFYRKVNESEPLPLSLEKKNYKGGGLNDYLPLVKNPKIKGAINARQYLKLVNRESKAIQIDYGEHQFNSLPADSFYVQTDLEEVVDQIPPRFQNLAKKKMEIKVKGRGLNRNDLVILDMIDTNKWERPIYFNFTSINSINLDLKKHVVQNGNTYRVLPIAKPAEVRNLVDEEKMYENLVENGIWRELDNSSVFYNDYYYTAIMAQRQNFNELTEALLDTGKIEKARITLIKSLDAFPDETFPYDVTHVQTTELLLAVNDIDTANQISQKLSRRAVEFLEYSINEPTRQREITKHLYTLRELAIMYTQNGFKEKGQRFAEDFEKYYSQLEG